MGISTVNKYTTKRELSDNKMRRRHEAQKHINKGKPRNVGFYRIIASSVSTQSSVAEIPFPAHQISTTVHPAVSPTALSSGYALCKDRTITLVSNNNNNNNNNITVDQYVHGV